mmetsp:Transcript_140614/g.448329  ORF Transcript_140614/g.448329 Transcript_140614/m.448329 type:complete len:277 (-) Transcript_140614:2499-3329(-)
MQSCPCNHASLHYEAPAASFPDAREARILYAKAQGSRPCGETTMPQAEGFPALLEHNHHLLSGQSFVVSLHGRTAPGCCSACSRPARKDSCQGEVGGNTRPCVHSVQKSCPGAAGAGRAKPALEMSRQPRRPGSVEARGRQSEPLPSTTPMPMPKPCAHTSSQERPTAPTTSQNGCSDPHLRPCEAQRTPQPTGNIGSTAPSCKATMQEPSIEELDVEADQGTLCPLALALCLGDPPRFRVQGQALLLGGPTLVVGGPTPRVEASIAHEQLPDSLC